MQIPIKRETILKNLPNGIPFAVKAGGGLKGYALRKGLIKLPYSVLNKAVKHLWDSQQITFEQYQTLDACLKSGDYSRVLNNRKIKRMIKII